MYYPLVLVITCLGELFGVNCPSTFLEILNFEIFKNQEGDLFQISPN